MICPKKKSGVSHDYKCDICGKPATYNVQDQWHSYHITDDGDFEEAGSREGGTNEFYCEEHKNN